MIIRQQPDGVPQGRAFAQSRRRERFLEFIVNETLAGRGDRPKGQGVALEVFDRPKTFDPLVRIEAARPGEAPNKSIPEFSEHGRQEV